MKEFAQPMRHTLFWGWLLCIAVALPCQQAHAVTAGELDDLRAQVNTNSTLNDESRGQLIGELDKARSQLEVAAEFRNHSSRLKTELERAPSQVANFEKQLSEAKENTQDLGGLVPKDSSVADIESLITLASAQRASMGDRRSQLLQSVDDLPSRREEIKKRLIAVQQLIHSNAATDTPAETIEQRVARATSQATLLAAEAEKASLEAEVLGEAQMTQVNAAERAWLAQAISDADVRLAALNEALESARASATREQLETTSELQEKLESQDPLLQRFADDNRRLAKLLQDTATQSDQARLEGQRAQALLEDIEQDSQLMQRRLQVAGRKEVLGRVMITRLDSLPATVEIERAIARRNQVIAETSLTQIDIEEDFRALNEGQAYLRELAPDLDQWDEASRALVRELVEQRSNLLENNLTSLGTLIRQLLDNNDRAGELIVRTEEFHRFLLGNLLWIRNFSYLEPAQLGQQLSIMVNPQNWLRLPQQLISGYHAVNWSSLMLLIMLSAFIVRRRLLPVYDELLSRPMLISGATFWNILAGFGLSLFLVLPWPLALYLAGYLLEEANPETQFSKALAPALMFTARILYIVLAVRLIASRTGVGRRYLKWDARILDNLQEQIHWAGPAICIALLIDVFAFELDTVTSGGPMGAISTAAIAVIIIVFCLRLLSQEVVNEAAMAKLGLRLCALISAATLVMQAMGLMYAADIYMIALGRSIIVLLIIKTVSGILERWLMILRARMERDAREAIKAQEETTEESAEEQEQEIDLASISEAHTKLLSMARIIATVIAIWVIWSPSLPALNLLDSVTLWSVTDSANPSLVRDITLFDLALSVVIVVVTVLLTRHLPSLSEVFMREWFNMSPGARYASSILMQYMVIAIGGSMFLSIIGGEWGKVQWLVAALGVGIGFGLQEIVANFISGIIILFERPVRVGDIISVGGQEEGVVKEINPRATIIETFDRKEHLIPNKELITGQVINWTLSDGAVRIIIPVGIAYGSDVRQALALLLEAAGEVENVLEEPAARATFEDFGDNALVLWLRCYASEDRIGTWTELRTRINDKFNDAGIVISFPQRDVHLDTLAPLQLEIRNPEAIKPA